MEELTQQQAAKNQEFLEKVTKADDSIANLQ